MRTRLDPLVGICFVAALLVAANLHMAIADDTDTKSEQRAVQAAAQMKLMRGLLDAWTIRAKGEKDESFTFAKVPLMRFSGHPGALLDGTVWRLGDKGRPYAYVTMELDRMVNRRDRITYEFLALSGLPFTISGRAVAWQPQESGLAFQKLPETQKPAGSEKRRLLQMKQFSRRFAAEQLIGKEKIVLRLVPRPIDRYKPNDAENSDAAVFAFSYGVNPEVALFIETDGEGWTFGCGRLSAATISVKLDNEQVWDPGRRNYRWTSSYTANRHYVDPPTVEPPASN